MIFGWFVVPITFFSGYMLGKKLHETVGITVSAVVGASAYILGLVILISPAAVFTFDIPTQLLMIAFGALVAIFGWFIGENYELPFGQRFKRKQSKS